MNLITAFELQRLFGECGIKNLNRFCVAVGRKGLVMEGRRIMLRKYNTPPGYALGR